jgi:hypothetical protein
MITAIVSWALRQHHRADLQVTASGESRSENSVWSERAAAIIAARRGRLRGVTCMYAN